MLYFVFIIFTATQHVVSYTIYTVDDPNVCNQSIYLEHGPNSAAILKMTNKDSYFTEPLLCTISFKVPIHRWSGLTGILEEVDLRTWDDSDHHLGQPFCVDHIMFVTEKNDPSPNQKQCGTWSVARGEPLSKLGYKRALVGYCPHSESWTNSEKCHVTEIKVIVSVGQEGRSYLWKNYTWKPHEGFTFVVTAYSYPIKNGESECRDGLRSCSDPGTLGSNLGVYHCIHDSLWCDGHINCGLLENMDEISCFRRGIWSGLVTVVIGPWMGASILLLLAFCGILYWRSSRLRVHRDCQGLNQDINSYAESYELSSNLSSAHHMAIQVRVVCNSNHPRHGTRNQLQQWSADLPPSYDTLFPRGPPATVDTTHQNVTASIIATVASNVGSALGVNVTSTLPCTPTPSTGDPSSEMTTSCQVPLVTNAIISSSEGSVIDLDVSSGNLANAFTLDGSDAKNKFSSVTNTQTSVKLTVRPTNLLPTREEQPDHSEGVVIRSPEGQEQPILPHQNNETEPPNRPGHEMDQVLGMTTITDNCRAQENVNIISSENVL